MDTPYFRFAVERRSYKDIYVVLILAQVQVVLDDRLNSKFMRIIIYHPGIGWEARHNSGTVLSTVSTIMYVRYIETTIAELQPATWANSNLLIKHKLMKMTFIFLVLTYNLEEHKGIA